MCNLLCAGSIKTQHDEFCPLTLRNGIFALMETFNESKMAARTLLILTPMKLYFPCIKEESSCKSWSSICSNTEDKNQASENKSWEYNQEHFFLKVFCLLFRIFYLRRIGVILHRRFIFFGSQKEVRMSVIVFVLNFLAAVLNQATGAMFLKLCTKTRSWKEITLMPSTHLLLHFHVRYANACWEHTLYFW